MSKGYFTTPLSEHLEETPEGFLIARDAVLGRTGWQTYKVSELPAEAADRLGVDTGNPNANIELYRPSEEVFAPDALASLNGKPITDGHPNSADGFVHPDNFTEFARGHVQNPRRGKEPLDDGEWPIVGDLHITAEPLLSKVRNKLVRELSLGYDYGLRRVGDRLEQCDFVYNHQAVVPRARAGPEARIADAAPPAASESPPTPASQEEPVKTTTINKVRKPVKSTWKHLLGLGLMERARATDADPEELAEAAMEIGKHQEPPAQSEDSRAADDAALLDAVRRVRDRKGTDADIAALKTLMGDYLSEEEEEPEHQADDVDTGELEETLGADRSRDEEPCETCGNTGEDCLCTDEEPAPGEQEAEPDGAERVADRARAADTVSGARAVLKALRPVMARTKDKAVQSAFNSALAAVTRSSRASSGEGYGGFARTARARDRAPRNPNPERARAADAVGDPIKKLQEAYDTARKGGK